MRLILSVIIAFLLIGCAPNYIKITKVDTKGKWLPFSAKADGLIVEKKGNISGISVVYKDKKGVVKVKRTKNK